MKYANIFAKVAKDFYHDANDVEVTSYIQCMDGDKVISTDCEGWLQTDYGIMNFWMGTLTGTGIRYFAVDDDEDIILYLFEKGENEDQAKSYRIEYDERYIIWNDARVDREHNLTNIIDKMTKIFGGYLWTAVYKHHIDYILGRLTPDIPDETDVISYLMNCKDSIKK